MVADARFAGRGPGNAGEIFPGTDMWRAAVLPISPWGETQTSDRSLLQHVCSLSWGRSAALGSLVVLSSHGSAGVEMLLLLLMWLLLQPTLWHEPLDFILNIYWTFGLMPITREVFYMMGVKAKDKFFQEAGLQKRNL